MFDDMIWLPQHFCPQPCWFHQHCFDHIFRKHLWNYWSQFLTNFYTLYLVSFLSTWFLLQSAVLCSGLCDVQNCIHLPSRRVRSECLCFRRNGIQGQKIFFQAFLNLSWDSYQQCSSHSYFSIVSYEFHSNLLNSAFLRMLHLKLVGPPFFVYHPS